MKELHPYSINISNELLTSVIVLCVLLWNNSYAQVVDSTATPYGAVGIYFSPTLSLHKASFSELPGIPNCCPEFRNSSGIGSMFGIAWEKSISLQRIPYIGKHIPLSDTPYLLSAKMYVENSNANFTEVEHTKVNVKGVEQDGQFQHELSTSIQTLNIDIGLGKENVWKALSIHTGLQFGALLGSNFNQIERITEPQTVGVFPENNLRTRNNISATIPQVNSLKFGLFTGLSWKLPLNSDYSMFARPELFVGLPFNNNVTDINWSTYTLRLGVSLFYVVPEIINLEPKYDTIPILKKPYMPTHNIYMMPAWFSDLDPIKGLVDLKVVERDSNKVEHPIDSIKISGYFETAVRPLLSYIFFDVLSSEIPERYILYKPEEVQNFSMKKLYNSEMLETYYNVLNIIALRMLEIPEAKITLTGCNMGNAIEGGKVDLSRKRAETVRDYLVNVWKIDESRIKINARNKPSKPSFFSDVDGEEENRRVEITSNILSVLEPVYTTDTLYIADPNVVYIKPINNIPGEVQNWKLTSTLSKEISINFNMGSNLLGEYDLNIEEIMKYITPKDTQLVFSFSVLDTRGTTYNAKDYTVQLKTSPAKKRNSKDSVGKHIEKYNLILFDYDDASFTPLHERTLNLIKSSISPESVVYVTGYTDRMGDDDYNQTLSEKRANAVARALGFTTNVHVVGLGESVIVYNNTTPEGRFYSRTIEIKIEKP